MSEGLDQTTNLALSLAELGTASPSYFFVLLVYCLWAGNVFTIGLLIKCFLWSKWQETRKIILQDLY